jgi:hypothetical protein
MTKKGIIMWEVKFEQTTDKAGLGTLTAVNGDFVYTEERVDTSKSQSLADFAARAKAKFSSKELEKTDKASVATVVANLLNK